MNFIRQNIYYILFISLIVEWPITAFVWAEYASQGKLNLFLFSFLAVLWDIIWDVCIYTCWRYFYEWKYINRLYPIKKVKEYVTEKKFLENLLEHYPFFFFLVVKITPYISTPSLFSVWMKKYAFWKYLFFSVIISCIVKAVYISLWYLWGISLAKLKLIQEWWSEMALFLIIWILLFYLMKLFLKKFSKKLIVWIKKYFKKFVNSK
jgi:membrane protein DedA with SNARE-associated domain